MFFRNGYGVSYVISKVRDGLGGFKFLRYGH